MVNAVLGATGALVAVIVLAVAAVFGSVLGGATTPGPAAVADIPGDDLALHAPRRGHPVRIADLASMARAAGATRPASTPGASY